jgi:hypothetical protein
MVKNEERDRPADCKDDMEVTPEMIEVGRDMLYAYSYEMELEESFVRRLFLAMLAKKKCR